MAVEDRIRSLRDKHASLENALQREETRRLPDNMRMAQIKREKLRIKDAIADLQR